MIFRVLQINATANWGSTGKIAESIGNAVIANGWESYIAYSRYANPSTSKLIKIGDKMDLFQHVAEARLFDKAGLSSRNATRHLIRQIREIKPDIVHLHNIHGYVLNYQLLFDFLNITNIKVVWTFHDCWAFTGHCTHFVTVNCNKWKSECRECLLKGDYPSSILFDCSERNFILKKRLFTQNESLTIVPVSDWLRNFVEESFLADKNIQIIHNGIDLNTFYPTTVAYSKLHTFNVLAVSNTWTKGKGLYDLFELRNTLPDKYRMTIVGVSAEQIKKLPDGITGIQRTQNLDELVQLYSNADVLVNPTYADTFPTVNLEALACGTPVITYQTGGSPEAVDELTGVVIAQGDFNAMAQAIIKMNSIPLKSSDCRARAVKLYDKNNCCKKYIELYENLLEMN